MESTEKQLREIVVEQLSVEPIIVTREAGFIDHLDADSLDVVELIMAVEEAFGLEIKDEDSERIRNFGQLVDYVEERKKETAP